MLSHFFIPYTVVSVSQGTDTELTWIFRSTSSQGIFNIMTSCRWESKSGNQVRVLNVEQRQLSVKTWTTTRTNYRLLSSTFSRSPPSTWVVTSSSTCTVLGWPLDARGASVSRVGRAPLVDEIWRIEMRLLSETKSVLEYLCQYFLIVNSLDIKVQQVVLQFPQDSNTRGE
jgi:hypothetical protein